MTKVYDYFEKYTFVCDWYEAEADKVRELCLNFFPFDNSIQIVDIGREMNFVSRVHYPPLKVEMLNIGSTVSIFSRLLFIKNCSHDTKNKLFKNLQSTFALIKPIPETEHGRVLTFILEHGFRIIRMKKARIDKDCAKLMYKSMVNDPTLPLVTEYVSSGEVIGLELVASDAIQKWRLLMGNKDPELAEEGTLRKLYGQSIIHNVVHGGETEENIRECLDYFFGHENNSLLIPIYPAFKNSTCCIVKPHALTDKNLGRIVNMITSAKFRINVMMIFNVDIVAAKEFFEVYDTVVPEYAEMAAQLAQGQCVVMEILNENPDEDCVCKFRQLCGPRDPDMCRQLFPDTIRAHYGIDIVRNAVHCTDLIEDGVSEVEYFFSLLLQDMVKNT